MIVLHARSISAVLFAVCAVTACGGAAGGHPDSRPAPAADSLNELEAIYRARTDSARMRFSEADARFMTGMIGHHAQAIVMGRLALDRSADPSIRTLAARIINAQRDEIATMQAWLRDRGRPVPELRGDGTELTVHGAHQGMPMHGMLTPEQMRDLEEARGPEFDRLFLRYMVQHHRGAVRMVDELFATDGAAQAEPVFRIASDIQVDQKTEIARMERMLSEMSGASHR